jgi:hypothetical protein
VQIRTRDDTPAAVKDARGTDTNSDRGYILFRDAQVAIGSARRLAGEVARLAGAFAAGEDALAVALDPSGADMPTAR